MKNIRHVLPGLLLLVSVGFGMLTYTLAFIEYEFVALALLGIVIGLMYGIRAHLWQLREKMPKVSFKKADLLILVITILAALITFYIHHELGLGPFIASGLVGVIAALVLSPEKAAAAYTASFVGMSAQSVLPAMHIVVFAGLIIGGLVIITRPVFAGWGGKGGITAASAALITILVVHYFA